MLEIPKLLGSKSGRGLTDIGNINTTSSNISVEASATAHRNNKGPRGLTLLLGPVPHHP